MNNMDSIKQERVREPRGRGRGVRTRGGLGRGQQVEDNMAQGVVVERRARGSHATSARDGRLPRPTDEMEIFMVENLPIGVPLERPLHPKKRRTWCPPSKTSTSAAASEPEVAVAMSAEDPAVLSPEMFEESSGGSPATSTHVGNSVGSAAVLPSPAMFEECSGGSPAGPSNSSSRHRTLKDDEILVQTNYGSEPESSEDDVDDDDMFYHGAMAVPRAIQATFETPEDPVPEVMEVPEVIDVDMELDLHHPRGIFEFEWKSFPTSSVPPELRRETFSNSNVGPTSTLSDPYNAFIAIWDHKFVEHIVLETNRYAQDLVGEMVHNNSLRPQSRICDWRDTNTDEMYVYFAIILAMGVVVKNRIDEYWNVSNDIFITPGFRALMSLRRFQLLSKCLHFNNNGNMSALELDPGLAKLFKIEPVLSHLNSRFQFLYNLDQNIALDESLLQWKGFLNINQLIPNKKAKIGIKSYEICESKTGYLWRFEMHAHQKQAPQQSGPGKDPMSASTPLIVLRLIQGLENKGHTLWMDNYYNSPALARILKSRGFDCVGTLRTNRQFVPETLTNLTKKNMRPGQITGFTSGDVDLMVWRDQNRVATISTYHGNAVSIVNGTAKPILISDYNIMMGGVDKKDQMLSMYPIERKRTKIWYKKLFRRFLNVSVLNSYILTRHTNSSLKHRSFRMSLIRSLVDKHSATPAAVLPPMRSRFFDARRHFLAEYPFLPGKSGRLRRACAICKKRIATYCVGCEKAVCLSSCFLSLHN